MLEHQSFVETQILGCPLPLFTSFISQVDLATTSWDAGEVQSDQCNHTSQKWQGQATADCVPRTWQVRCRHGVRFKARMRQFRGLKGPCSSDGSCGPQVIDPNVVERLPFVSTHPAAQARSCTLCTACTCGTAFPELAKQFHILAHFERS